MDVNKTREQKLCVSCEICKVICPVNAIDMEYKKGQFLPKIDEKSCINCGKCLKVCPGTDIELYNGDSFEEWLTGSYIEGYSAYTKNRDILKNSTSGGVISQLLIDLLGNGDYEGAFVLPFDMFDGKPARLELAKIKEEIKNAAKSKYIPASVFNTVERLTKESNPNYVIVGTPCQLKGIMNFIDINGINDEDLLFFGLFCEKTLNFNVLNYFEEKYSKENEKMKKFDYKNKEKDGWPGHPKLYFDSGRELFVDRSERIQIKDYFQLERCLYCLDKLNRQADISFGDCYITGRKNPGRSSIIIRTRKGKEIWEKYSHMFNKEKSSIESIKKSQCISRKKENLDFIKGIKGRTNSYKLKKKQKRINFGRKREFNKINKSLSKNKLEKYHRLVQNLIGLIKIGGSIYKTYFKDLFKNKNNLKNETPKNVIIFGGGLSNKGAQAMTFTVVDQMKRRFPIENIYVFNTIDYKRDELEKRIYSFKILPWKIGTAINLLNKKRIIDENKWTCSLDEEKMLKRVLHKADVFIDISGYGLRSWGYGKIPLTSINQVYLLRIMLAKKLSKPYFILPQSIGPFSFNLIERFWLSPQFKLYLKYPKIIYSREPQGVEELKPFTKKNVKNERDIVLLNDGYNFGNIFKNEFDLKNIKIKRNSVGVIPNKQVMKRGNKKEIYKMYKSIINKLLENGKCVYILRHSEEDFFICSKIKNFFSNNENVMLISGDMNTIELENIIKQFDFIVGSRYHSIINAFKNGIPAFVLGWANKYEKLLEDFEQNSYIFDIRKDISFRDLERSLRKILVNHEKESKKIISKLGCMEKNPVFKRFLD